MPNHSRKPHPLRDRARDLRTGMELAERMLWESLRNRQVAGFRFRRQHPIGSYIADFVCLEAKLIIELDGSQHRDQQMEDATRTEWLESQGYQVLRFWNHQVFEEFEGVVEGIWNALQTAKSAVKASSSRRDQPPA